MELNELSSISPIDGRYRHKVQQLAPYFSEFGLIKYRLQVEVEYFIELLAFLELKKFTTSEEQKLRAIYQNFNFENAQSIKNIEKITNHDVKAVEYFLKEAIEKEGLSEFKEWIHFGLTSQDINNTAIPLSLKESMTNEYLPLLESFVAQLLALSNEWKDIPMLAKTHGQPASPTYLGKEVLVFAERIKGQLTQLQQVPMSAKFGGATGNFNAHYIAFPEQNWQTFANNFVKNNLGLSRTFPTTQIEPYDNLAAFSDAIKRINNIIIDFCRDVWTYISMDYFTQKTLANEVGSSAMPHKVNPIDFENAEGNLGIANALLEHFSAKLPISRLQRDLTDSTVLRNLGVPIAHSLLSLTSVLKGLSKLLVNKSKIDDDLNANFAVVAEAIQTILRRENVEQPYEKLKTFSRGKGKLNQNDFKQFIQSLAVSEIVKNELLEISPFNFTGYNPLK